MELRLNQRWLPSLDSTAVIHASNKSILSLPIFSSFYQGNEIEAKLASPYPNHDQDKKDSLNCWSCFKVLSLIKSSKSRLVLLALVKAWEKTSKPMLDKSMPYTIMHLKSAD